MKRLCLLFLVFALVAGIYSSSLIHTRAHNFVNTHSNRPQLPDQSRSVFTPLVFKNYNLCPVYLFLDCHDIDRIRTAIQGGESEDDWQNMIGQIEDFLLHMPTEYNTTDKSIYTWYSSLSAYAPRTIALAYLVAQDTRYGQAVIDLLMLIAQNTPDNELFIATDRAVYYSGVIFSYSAVRESPLLSNANKTFLDDFFFRQTDIIQTDMDNLSITPWWWGGNVFLMPVFGEAMYAMALKDDPRFTPYYLKAHQRIDDLLHEWIDADGAWLEKADNYSILILQNTLLYQQSVLKTMGEDIFNKDFNGKTMRDMCGFYANVVTPEGTPPSLNDGSWGSQEIEILKLCAMRANDPALAFAADRYWWGLKNAFNGHFAVLPDLYFHRVAWVYPPMIPTEPDWFSVAMPNAGVVVLRSDWSLDAQYLLLQFTHTEHHQHYSYGNIILYDQGYWMLENGYQSADEYSRSVSSIEHSTITRDDQNHNETGGTLSFYTALANSAMATIYTKLYPDYYQQRSVLWVKGWHQWLVADENYDAGAFTNHTLRWYIAADSRSGSDTHWVFTRNDRQLWIDLLLPFISSNGSPIERTYLGNPIGNALGISAGISEYWPTFSLISLPKPGEIAPGLTEQTVQNPVRGLWTISSRKGTEQLIWLYPWSKHGIVESTEYTINGNGGWVLKDSSLLGYGLFGGQQLKSGIQKLINSNWPASVDVQYGLQQIGVETRGLTAIELYWTGTVNSITDQNGLPISFNQNGDYLLLELPTGAYQLTVH